MNLSALSIVSGFAVVLGTIEHPDLAVMAAGGVAGLLLMLLGVRTSGNA